MVALPRYRIGLLPGGGRSSAQAHALTIFRAFWRHIFGKRGGPLFHRIRARRGVRPLFLFFLFFFFFFFLIETVCVSISEYGCDIRSSHTPEARKALVWLASLLRGHGRVAKTSGWVFSLGKGAGTVVH